MLAVVVSAVTRVFPGVPVERVIGKIVVEPAAQRQATQALLSWTPPDAKLVGPCGGFSAQYACMCDYYSLPFREEVAWDVDTIYFSHDSHEMCLQDFEHLDHRDQLCIISSLEHNTWFTRLKASGNSAKLSADICDRILQVVAKSSSLQELHVPGIGARWEFAARLSQAIAHNPASVLASFDLSCNFVEDKGLNQLSAVIGKRDKGLKHVNLSYCSLSVKGLSNFASALCSARVNSSTLTYLNLAGNAMKDESQALCNFLARPNVIAILDISATETPLDVLFGALVRGCVTALTHLNLSRNHFSSKKAKEIPAAFKQFFASTLVLQYLNMSHCKVPPEAVKHLLLGLACNENTANVELNLSNNSLGAAGATVIESCVGGVKCVSRLDLSDNSIEAEMAGVMQGVARSHSILSLNVSRNMTGAKPKHLPAVMESIVQLIQDEETVLQKLNLSDCKLKAEINNVINALGSNQCLQHLDISGNMMGDVGARLLAKALQINTRLRIVNLDRNGITLQGYTDITYALQSNYAMRHIPFPTFDMQPFVKTHPDRVDGLVHRMQELLQRNASPHRFRNTSQAFRLTQGFLLSSTQQILDRVSAQTQDNIDAIVKLNPDVGDSDDIGLARGMIQDAENSKHLLSALHEVTARGSDVDQKLKSTSLELSNFITSHVHQNVDAMIACAESQCPKVMGRPSDSSSSDSAAEARKADLRSACLKKCQISPDFVSGLIMDQLGLEIHNKINELNLIIANHISDRVIDEVIEGLGSQSKLLVSEMGSLRKKRSLTPDSALGVPLGGKGRSSSISESLEQESVSISGGGDGVSQKSESSPLSTPQTSKRKTLQGRKLRPKSVSDGKQQDQEKDEFSSSSSVLSELTQSKGPVKNGPGEEDTVPELPSTSALQHLGKARPKRPKRHAPSRGAVVQQQYKADDDDDGGLTRFYSSPANSSFSPGSTPSGSPMQESSALANSSVASNTSVSSVLNTTTTPTASPIEKRDEKKLSSGLLGMQKKTSSPEVDRRSPLPPKADKLGKPGAGLSCLSSSTLDDDHGATATVASAASPLLTKPSPEKRALSPSLHSITDMFSSSRQKDKVSSPKPEIKGAAGTSATSPGGVSPFASRKTDSELLVAGKRRSYGPSGVASEGGSALSPSSSDDAAGKRTPEGVVKRVGVGHGGNLDLMAEMKEKRASMQPKSTSAEGEGSPSKVAATTKDDTAKASFGQVKLR